MPPLGEIAIVDLLAKPHEFASLMHHLRQSVLCFVAIQPDGVPHET